MLRTEGSAGRWRSRRRGALDTRAEGQSPAQRLGITTRSKLGGDEQGNDTAWTRELDSSLSEGYGEIRKMGEAARGSRLPARVARRECFAHALGQPFGSHPRRIADHEIEPTVMHHIGELRLERAEGSRALLSQLAASCPQLTPRLMEPLQALALLGVEAAPPAEQIAIPRGANPFGDGRLECAGALVQQPPGQHRLGAVQLDLRRSLFRPGQEEVLVTGRRETPDFRCASSEGPATQ